MEKEVDIHLSETGAKSIAEIKAITGSDAYAEAKLKEPPKPLSARALILYLASLVGFFCSTMNGYDGSLLNGLLMNDTFTNFFSVGSVGIGSGIVTSMYQIGSVVALPFVGPIIDGLGRRGGMFVGAIVIIVGTIVQSLTTTNAHIGQFEGGRFLLGFGVSIASSAGPIYVVEASHPAFRGVVTALYNTFWFVGSMVAGGVVLGTITMSGNKSWAIPVWLQLMFSGFIVIFVWFLPESPRWLYVNGKREKAKEMITYYHGEGNPDSAWVQLQLREYEEYLETDGSDKRWWDYRALFRDRASIYRLCCNIAISVFGQWAGNAVYSYFLAGALDSAGVSEPEDQARYNLALYGLQFGMALIGAACVDFLGRRTLLLTTNIGCSITWIGMVAACAQFDKSGNDSATKGAIAMIFLFGAIYAFGFTPLQALYPVEVLSFEQRAKGMAFSSFALNAAMLMNQFAWPVAMKNIGWKTYIVFIVWDAVQATLIYFFIPETRHRTLEELDEIFKAKNPRKASTKKHQVALDVHANVVDVKEV